MVIPRYEKTLKKTYNYLFPIGIGYILSSIKNAGYNINCLNLNHCNGTLERNLIRELNKIKYDFVMIGSNTLGYLEVGEIIKICNSHKSLPKTVVGGTLITGEPKLVFKNLNVDYGIVDEGDEAIVELLKRYEKCKELTGILGVLYKNKKGEIVYNGDRAPPKNLDKIPFPDYGSMGISEFLDNQNPNMSYIHSAFDFPRVYYMVGGRSCPFRCTFCWHYNHCVRFRSIDNIMKELNERVKKYKINRLYILDECFAIDKKRLIEFCYKMQKLRKDIDWDLKWVTSIRVTIINESLLKLLKESGCDTISYGFESYDSEVLKSMRKGITPKQIDYALKQTMKAKISMQGNFIFGDVAETKETAYKTLNYWKKECNGQIHLGFIRPYPNSAIYKYCIEKKIIKNKTDFLKDLVIDNHLARNFSKMSDSEFNKLEKDVLLSLGKHRKIVTPLKMKKRANGNYDLLVKCPFCKKIISYGNYRIKNKLSYSSVLSCRNCKLRFYIANSLRKFALKHYNHSLKIKELIEKIRFRLIKNS